MNKKELTAALESIGMRPGRGLGQNFLMDNNLLDSIVRMASIQPGELILEVGPGFGALTRRLLDAGAEVYAIEFDHRLADYLRKHIDSDQFHLVEDYACRVDYKALLPEERPFRSVANLPYSISSVFIARMLGLANMPQSMLFLLQKEMGERLSARVGTHNYGALSVRTQLEYAVKIEKNVPPEVFLPPPAVDSAVVSFHRAPQTDAPEIRRLLPGVVKTVFAQRRKQMGKVLGNNYGKERAAAAMEKCGLPHEIRPERLSVEDFVRLTQALYEVHDV
ncbi:MAG: 16S rRNA (adenine(1518)-N(6)/adenine(1519)-N(6))-dimethyltransferase RsmA [Victivallaceae bacterium]|nr:16S rRNA (adenine(1518)-N(6)/adenine(1519)-N(6))-dimethyltransferase RsmA [Victivallaceae bacterium]